MSIRSHFVCQSNKILVLNNEQLFDVIYLSPLTFGMIVTTNIRGQDLTKSQINWGTTDENKNSKIFTIKILLDDSTSTSIICEDNLDKRLKILNQNKNSPLLQGLLIILPQQSSNSNLWDEITPQ